MNFIQELLYLLVMKWLVLLCILISYQLNAQLVADAGKNIHFCTYDSLAPINANRPNLLVGGSPTARGGTPPYTYKWTLNKYPQSILDAISSDTIANPEVKKPVSSYIPELILKVTDNLGNVAYDSVHILKTQYIYHTGEPSMSKNKDDTVSISHNCRSNFPLTKCDCSPKTYLSDTISCPNKTFSPYNIKYNCILYDTLGCKEVSQTDVYIQTSRINEIEGTKIWDNFVNPINNKTIYSISKENEEFQISIYDVSGKLIYQNKLLRELNIGKILLNSGIYLARIIKNNQVQYSVKLEKI